jgi:hypothetical protein
VLLISQYLDEHWPIDRNDAIRLMHVMLDVAYRANALEMDGDQLPLFTLDLLDWLLKTSEEEGWAFTPNERSLVMSVMIRSKGNNANKF